MALYRLQEGTRSPKRRKLNHGSDDDDSDILDQSPDEAIEGVSNHTRMNSSAKNSLHHRKSSANKTTTMKPTVLPAGGISKSAIIALQLADLVAEVTPDYDRIRPRWTAMTDQLVTLIKGLPNRSPVSATEATKSFRKQGIRIPWPQPAPAKETNYKFEFVPPTQFAVGGLLPQGLSLKGKNVIDVTTFVPDAVLQEKDYLNNRALHKAAFYLACIAEAAKEQLQDDFEVLFTHLDDVDLLPILEIVPKDAKLSKYTFRLLVGLPSQSVPREKTLPSKNCLKQLAAAESTKQGQPTPFYNSAISLASAIATQDSRIWDAVAQSSAFAEACRVGQLWLRQRGFSSSVQAGGFGASEWASMCALLLEKGGHHDRPLFSKQYSSLQFFKAMLQLLGGRDLLKQPMLLSVAAKLELGLPDVPMLYDGTTGVNVLYKMSPWSYHSLRHHAQISLTAINSKSQDSFDATFVINAAVPLLQHDEIYSVRISGSSFETPAEEREFLHNLHKVLTKGLGDRATLVDFELPAHSKWALTKEPPRGTEDYEIGLALKTNPDSTSRLVDHGPSADDQGEAALFREFWGEKAELRRFMDGSISEALVWSQSTPVTLQILQHLASLHSKLPSSSIISRSSVLDSEILENDAPLTAVSVKDAFRLIDTTFQTLTSTFFNLEGLPLPIRSVSPVSPALRFTSTLHPLLPSSADPIDILIQFDSSTRWPDSLPAIQYTKIAFLLKLSDLLNASDTKLTTTRVGLENTSSATSGHFNTSFLDIIYPSPAPGLSPICFRARIHHDRELHLLQTELQDKSLHGAIRDSLARGLATHKRDFQAKPAHTLAIRNLITRFPTLSTSIRLLKRWISAHMLSMHIPEEILEIFSASVFLQPLPFSTPGGSPTTAFLRCLSLLARWDWVSSPLVVDLSATQDGLSEAQRKEFQTRLAAWRKLDPAMNSVCWVVGSSVDATGTVWTGDAMPSKVVAARVTALAREAVRVIESQEWKGLSDSVGRGLFAGELGDFDFLIHLKQSVVRGHSLGKGSRKAKTNSINGLEEDDRQFKNLTIAPSLDVDSLGFDPVRLYLQDLQHAFSSAALFFYDSYAGGNVIGGLWRPSVLGRKEWRVRLGWSSVPVEAEEGDEEGKEMCLLNREGVLAEMAALGEGLVRDVKVNKG